MSEPTLSKCFICTKESEDGRFLYPEESDFVFYQLLGVSKLKQKQTHFAQWIKFKNVCYCSTCLEKILKFRVMVGDYVKLEEKILTERTNILKQLIESSDSLKNVSDGKPNGMLQVLREEIVEEVDIYAEIKWTLRNDVYFSHDNSPEESEVEVKTIKKTIGKSTELSRRKSAESQTEDDSKKYDLRKKPHRLSRKDKIEPKGMKSPRSCLPRKCNNIPDIATMVTADDANGIKSKSVSSEESTNSVDKSTDDFEIFTRNIISQVHNMSSSTDGEMEIFGSEDTLRVSLTKRVPIRARNEKLNVDDAPEQSCIEDVSYLGDICDQMFNDNNSFDTHKLMHTVRAGENKTVQEHGQDMHVDKKDTLVLTDDEMILSQDSEILKQAQNIPRQGRSGSKKILEDKNVLKQGEASPKCVTTFRRARVVLKRLAEVSKLSPEIPKQEPNYSKQDPKSLKQDRKSLKHDPIISGPIYPKRKKPKQSFDAKPKSKQSKTCKECLKVFSTLTSLNHHALVIHRDRRIYKCQLCDFIRPSLTELKDHMVTSHSGTKRKRFRCNLCDQSFKKNNNLQRHQKCHNGYTPFMCVSCHGSFNNHVSLVKHIRLGDCLRIA